LTDIQKSVVIGNGDFILNERIKALLDSSERIVCADGGANHLIDTGYSPELIIGDMDSILPVTVKKFNKTEIIKDTDENTTDSMKAIEHELSKGMDEIILLGATGQRIDHSVANLSLLKRYDQLTCLTLLDDFSETVFVQKDLTFEAEIGRKISLMVLGGSSWVTTKGLKWELDGELQSFGPFGISNQVAEPSVSIKVFGDGLFLFKLFEKSDGTPIVG